MIKNGRKRKKIWKRAGYPLTKQVSVFFKSIVSTSKALNVDPSQLNKVVNAAYAN